MKNNLPLSYSRCESFLVELFHDAIGFSYPDINLDKYLYEYNDFSGRIIVTGAGKAAASMVKSIEENTDIILSGAVVVPYGYKIESKYIEILEASHPLPDKNSVYGAERILELCSSLTENDLHICLLSGGGSSLLCRPLNGVSLNEKQVITNHLLNNGANINELNTVRSHLSQIKGGKLALAAYPARSITIAISDVPSDNPSIIASGPTVGDISTRFDALNILEKYKINISKKTSLCLLDPKNETLQPDDHRINHSQYSIVCKPFEMLNKVTTTAKQRGLYALNLGANQEGISRELAETHLDILNSYSRGLSTDANFILISGGESSVKKTGHGRGGPNLEYLLALAIALDGREDVFAIACDTDGFDGESDAAGAVITPTTMKRARKKRLNPEFFLKNNDSHNFFNELGDLIFTGPTHTNVNDFRAITKIS